MVDPPLLESGEALELDAALDGPESAAGWCATAPDVPGAAGADLEAAARNTDCMCACRAARDGSLVSLPPLRPVICIKFEFFFKNFVGKKNLQENEFA